jgi:Uma2 family endonuclease
MQVREVPTQINFSPLLRRYTLEEFWALPEREDRAHYDLIGGHLFMVPPPNPPHGNVDARMLRALFDFLVLNKIEGEVHHPREAIWRSADDPTYLEPDMMYVSKSLSDQMGEKRTSADIVFEYLSRSTSIYDRTTKADTYLALGVRELWLIDPVTVTIEVRHAREEKGSPAWEVCVYPRGEQAKSRVLEGWEVSVSELFDGLVRPSDTDES